MLRPRGLNIPAEFTEAKLFGLGLGLVASGIDLVETHLVASKVCSIHDIN